MSRLLHDRFLMMTSSHACDLATGEIVPTGLESEPRTPGEERSSPAELLEVLDHGRDGCPRMIAAEVASRVGWKDAVDRIAAAAVTRGYVPVAVDLYPRLLATSGDDVAGRTLLLIASERSAAAGRQAFLDSTSRSANPHVLLTLRTDSTTTTLRVREARAAYAPAAPRRRPTPLPADVVQQLQRAERATTFVASGRHAAAERLLRDVAGALARRSATAQSASIAIRLGRLLLERGRATDAVRVFAEAVAAATAAGDEWLAPAGRTWLAIARTDAGQLTAAESICRALLLAGNLPPSLRTWTQAVLIRVLLCQQRLHDARALRLESVTAASELEPALEAFVRATDVHLLLLEERIFDAGVRAGQLMTWASDVPAVARLIAVTSYMRVLLGAGDFDGAELRLREIVALTRTERLPLRALHARMIWLDALIRAGRARDADRELRTVTRLGRAAPSLVQQAITHCARSFATTGTNPDATNRCRLGAAELSAAVLVGIAQEDHDDGATVRRLLDAAIRRLGATRLDVWSADAGPASIVESAGTGQASTLGNRVLEAGIPIGPETAGAPIQFGLPVRLGSRLLAALVARWPIDRVPPPDAQSVLELVAAVAAPRIDALLHRARAEAEAATLIPELVGVSRAVEEVRRAVARAAAAPFSVLVEGESGVGKELIARAVHYLSPRRERRFCDLNCAALPDDLIESELFGHAKGAFTGAVADRPGLFEDAHGGTVFLDEVADLSPRAQAKLLRVIQQQEVRRVGETFTRAVDVRLVAAANRDMRAEVSAGRFRQDLLYRIDVIRIAVPALRERPEDVPVLAQHFWRTAADRVGTLASLSSPVLAALAAYSWPGNVREMQNVVAALAVAAPRRGRVGPELLPAAITGATPVRSSRLADARDQFERRFVEAALARAGGNRTKAARALGLSRQGLLKVLDRLAVSRST